MVSRIFEHFQVDVPLQDFWEMPTVARLAERIQHKRSESFPEQELDRLVTAIEQLSDEDVQQLLAKTESDE